jgi:colicin import membrane protein
MKPGKSDSFPPQPPRERGTTRAFTLALLMHVLLGLFLYHGIHWQNSTPAGAEAELWTDIPQQQTPPPPAPPVRVAPPAPPVPDEQADIALQQKKCNHRDPAARGSLLEQQERQRQLAEQEAQAKRQRELQQQAELAAQKAAADKLKKQQAEKLRQQQLAEQQKQEQLKQQKEEELKQQQLEAQKKAEAEKAAKAKALAQQQAKQKQQLDQERRARLAQLQGLAGESSSGNGLAKGGTGTGSGGTAASPGYADKVRRRVAPNVHWPPDNSLETLIAVRCAPTGTLLSATIQHSSGNPAFDDAALRAVRESDPMPLDTNGQAPASFSIKVRPPQ